MAKIYRFFKMAAAAILDFWNYKFLTVGHIMSFELHHHAKFCGDRSNCCRDISILDFSRWRPPPSWILEISKLLTSQRSRGSNCVRIPHFVKIARTSSEICQFSIFGGRRHLGFLKFQIFNSQEDWTASSCQISSRSVKTRPRYRSVSYTHLTLPTILRV